MKRVFEFLVRASGSLAILLLLDGVYVYGFLLAFLVALFLGGGAFLVGTILAALDSKWAPLIEFLAQAGCVGFLIGIGTFIVAGILVVDLVALLRVMASLGAMQALAGMAFSR